MENLKSINQVLKYCIKNKKIELYGGKNRWNSMMPGFKEKEWVELVGITRQDNCEGGFGIIIKRKNKKTKVTCSVCWFEKIRIK